MNGFVDAREWEACPPIEEVLQPYTEPGLPAPVARPYEPTEWQKRTWRALFSEFGGSKSGVYLSSYHVASGAIEISVPFWMGQKVKEIRQALNRAGIEFDVDSMELMTDWTGRDYYLVVLVDPALSRPAVAGVFREEDVAEMAVAP
jgi:S1-C subfamily serine protease